MKKYITKLSLLSIILLAFSSCELERLESAQEVADGGGTVNTFNAYTIESSDPMGTNVYGRVVFWKTDLDQTLVQVSLYNTIASADPDASPNLYPVAILDGMAGVGTTTLVELNDVQGATGEFFTDKFYLISDTSFYDALEGTDDVTATYDAHINIYDIDGTTLLAAGDIGVNADPIDSSN